MWLLPSWYIVLAKTIREIDNLGTILAFELKNCLTCACFLLSTVCFIEMCKYISLVYEDFPIFPTYYRLLCFLPCFARVFSTSSFHVSLGLPLFPFILDLDSHIRLTWDFPSSLCKYPHYPRCPFSVKCKIGSGLG